MWLHWTRWGSLVCFCISLTWVTLTTELYVYCDLLEKHLNNPQKISCNICNNESKVCSEYYAPPCRLERWFRKGIAWFFTDDNRCSQHWFIHMDSAKENVSGRSFKPTNSECYSKHIWCSIPSRIQVQLLLTEKFQQAVKVNMPTHRVDTVNSMRQSLSVLWKYGFTCAHKCPLPTMSWVRWTVVQI